MLRVPNARMEELKEKSVSDPQYREWLVKYWLKTYPWVGWQDLGGRLLRNEVNAVFQVVKGKVKPENGECVALHSYS